MSSLLSALIVALAVPAAGAHAQDGVDTDGEEFQRWIAYYKRIAADYDFRLQSDPDTRLPVTADPVMTYSIPEDRVHGAFFVWTHRGRPEVIGSIWSGDPNGRGWRGVLHEFHSLSLGPLEPVRVGDRRWRPVQGIELSLIPDAPPPSESEPLRLAQMRTLARRFTGYSTPHGKELTLRTQTQPLYRYESEAPEVLDGAIFAMFAGWDPDIMLLIEARDVDSRPQWHYGVGRFNAVPLRLEYQDMEVWKTNLVPMNDPTSTFYATVVETRHASDVPPASRNELPTAGDDR